MHGSVEDTKLSTNKQHTLEGVSKASSAIGDGAKLPQLPRATGGEPITKIEHLVDGLDTCRGQDVLGAEY